MNDVIYKIYGLKNRGLYFEKLNKAEFDLPQEIAKFCEINNIAYGRHNVSSINTLRPSWRWDFTMPSYVCENERTDYHTVLYISKLCPVFYLHSRYRTMDRNPDALGDRTLEADGYSGGPVTSLQEDLYVLIEKLLDKMDYLRVIRMIGDFTVVGIENLTKKRQLIENGRRIAIELCSTSYFDIMFKNCYDDFNVIKYYYTRRKHDNAQ